MSSYDDILGKKGTLTQETDKEPDAPKKGMIDYGTPGQRVAAGPEDSEPDASSGTGGNTGGIGGSTGGGSNTAVGRQAEPGTTTDTTPQPRRYLTYDDIRQELKRQDEVMRQNRPETDEERQAREKREKRNKMFAALGDGISALSNLYFTTKGAPNMYNPSTSLSGAAQRRMDMARQAREKERAAYNAAATARYATLTDADSRARKWDELERQKRLDAEGKVRKDALAEAQAGRYKAAQDKDEAQVAYYNKKVELLERGFSVDQAEKIAKIAKLDAEADRARRQGTESWVSGSGSKSGGSKKNNHTLFNKETGQTETFSNRSEFLRRAGELGYYTGAGSSSHSESDDGYGGKKTSDVTRNTDAVEASIGRQEAEARRQYKEQHKPKAATQRPAPKTAPKLRKAANGKYYTGGVKWK